LISLITLIVLVAGLGTTACGQKAASEKSFEGKTLRVVMVDEPREQALKEMAGEFEEKTGAKVVIDLLGFEQLTTKTMTASEGKTGEYDVMQIVYFEMPVYARDGWLFDLTDWVERDKDEVKPDDIHPVLREGHAEVDGKWYGMPMHVNTHAFFYRKDIFDEMGLEPPKDWDDAIQIAKQITEAKAPEVYGITFMGAADLQLGGVMSEILTSQGGYFYDTETYEPTVDTEAGIKSFQILQELTKWAPPGVAGYALDTNYNAFAQGNAAMCPAWTTGVFYFDDPEQSKIAGKWEVMAMPGGATLMGGWSLTVSEYSKNKELAWEFIKWATSPEMEEKLLGNMETPRVSMLTDEEIQEEYPNNKAFYRALEGGPAHWPQIRGSIGMLVTSAVIGNEVVIGDKTPEEAAKALNEEVRQILITQGYLEK
jgi:multiple sugar transport system substrate-binding protein